ncbi:hypothetical protein Tco_1345443 [Tanacetum coccineum]
MQLYYSSKSKHTVSTKFLGGGFGARDEAGGSSFVSGGGSPADDFFDSQTINTATSQEIHVPHWDVTNDTWLDDPVMCRNMIDHVSPPSFRASLNNHHDTDFLDLLNSSKIVQHRDAEIVALKAKVREAESAVVEVNGLHRRISELEAVAVAKSEEVAGLSVQNAELLGRVSGLELVCDGLKGQVTKLEADCESLHSKVAGEARLRVKFASISDTETWRFKERSAELDAHITELNHDIDVELYPHMLTVVVGRRWEGLEASIKHGKAGRSLIDAYDCGVGAAYVGAVNEFENLSFTLLEQLEALKDSPHELIMFALTLEGDSGDKDLMTLNNVTFITSFILFMEYLVKISKKACTRELKQRNMKITVLTSYTPYPSRKIRRICACVSQETTKIQRPIHLTMTKMSRIDVDLFTYEVEIPGLASVPCDLSNEDYSEQLMTRGSNMEYDPSNVEFTEWLALKLLGSETR